MTALLDRYRQLPQLAGRLFLPIGFLARLPMSMAQLGTVLMVSAVTGSIAFAGLLAGAMALGAAIGGPIIGLLADRHGQRTVMVVASLVDAAALIGLVVAINGHASRPVSLAIGVLAGAAQPQVGALLRSRWVMLTGGGGRLGTAMSYEGAADEVAYVLGPAVVSVLALISPSAGVIVAAALVGVFGAWIGLHPTARVRSESTGAPSTGGDALSRNPTLIALMALAVCIGAFFGGTQTGVTALADSAGVAASAGLIYAVMAVGSAVAGLATGALPDRFRLHRRLLVFACWLTLAVVPLLFLHDVVAAAAVMLVLGAAVGPLFITMYSMAEREVSASRTGVVMTVLSAGTVVGYAVGAAVGGRVAQQSGSGAAFAVSLVAIGLGSAATAILGRRLTRAVAVVPAA